MNRDIIGREGTNASSRSIQSSHPLINACVGCMGETENGCADNYEPGASRSGQWSYVGNGRGGYEQVDQYSYVGEGAGSFKKEIVQVHKPAFCPVQCSWISILILIVSIIAAGCCAYHVKTDETQFLADNLNHLAKAHQTKLAKHVEPSAAAEDHRRNDSDSKRDLHHRRHHRSAVVQHQTTTTIIMTEKLSPAIASVQHQQFGWLGASGPKGKSTEEQPMVHVPNRSSASSKIHVKPLFNCKADVFNWAKTWTLGKKLWCCEHENAGCAPPTRPSPEHCNVTCNWEASQASCQVRIQWAADNSFTTRKHACSAAHGLVLQQCPTCSQCTLAATGCEDPPRGTTQATTSIPYDCAAEIGNWRMSWSDAKMLWCCNNFGTGCRHQTAIVTESPLAKISTTIQSRAPELSVTSFSSATRSTQTTHATQRSAITSAEDSTRSSTSQSADLSSATTLSMEAASPLFDCAAGLNQWKTRWSAGKKMWCCEQKKKGCPSEGVITTLSPSTTTYDCSNPSWSIANQEFCCKHHQIGCKMLGVSSSLRLGKHLPNESLEGLATARKTQDVRSCSKVCAIYGVEQTCSARIQYAARHDYSDASNSCAKAIVAVLSHCPECASCSLANANCEDVRASQSVGTSVPYDCNAGLDDWARGWSLHKKDWCCENEFVGCPTQKMASPYNCEPGANNWLDGWSSSKRKWCCKVHKKGCADAEVDA